MCFFQKLNLFFIKISEGMLEFCFDMVIMVRPDRAAILYLEPLPYFKRVAHHGDVQR
jgi:hypothetical protein